jgi:hypothetical protein
MQALVEQKDKLLQPDPCSLLSVLRVLKLNAGSEPKVPNR